MRMRRGAIKSLARSHQNVAAMMYHATCRHKVGQGEGGEDHSMSRAAELSTLPKWRALSIWILQIKQSRA